MTPHVPTRTRGWCPGVLDPMETGDGWLLRVRLPGGAVSPDGLRLIADTAALGSGAIEITSRGNLQLRGFDQDTRERAAATLVAGGLAAADVRLDACRAIVASPLTGHDPAALVCSTGIVAAIGARLAEQLAGTLPSKFGIVVDDGGSWDLAGIDADLRLRWCGTGWAVFVRGHPAALGPVADPVTTAAALAALCAAANVRADVLVTNLGVGSVAAALGVEASGSGLASSRPTTRTAPGTTESVAADTRILGVVTHPDLARSNVLAAPSLGRLDASRVRALADVATALAAEVRLTPAHSIAFCGVAAGAVDRLMTVLTGLDLIVDPADPRSLVSACVGSAGCSSGRADTVMEATNRAAATGRERLHLSACPKGCGAPVGVRVLIADETGTFR